VQLTTPTRTLDGVLQYLQEEQQDTIQIADIPVYTKTVYIAVTQLNTWIPDVVTFLSLLNQ